jgi:hypothetical protein
MVRSWVVVFEVIVFLAGALASNVALAQCRGGGGQGGSTGTTGTTGVTSTAGLMGLGVSPGLSANQGSGSLTYGMLMSQIAARQMLAAQQMAQQQAMLAMQQQQQQIRADKLAARKYRAEQSRSQVAASRVRTRALLAAQSGLPAANKPPATLVAFNAVKR